MANELAVIKSVEARTVEIMSRIKVFNRDDELWTDSLSVAEAFGKIHRDLMVVIRKIDKENQLVNLRTFTHIKYCDSRGREQDAFEMTETGFSSVVGSFNDRSGTDIALIKAMYRKEFHRLKQAEKNKPPLNIQEMIPGLSAVMISMQRFIDDVHTTRKENQQEHSEIQAKVIKVEFKVDAVEEKIDRVERKLDDVIDLGKRRRDVSAPNRRTHIDFLFHRYRGACPCCGETQILDDHKQPIIGSFEMDHFFDKTRNKIDETWPICKTCNGQRANGGLAHNDAEGFFIGYQSGLRVWSGKKYKQLDINNVMSFRHQTKQ